MKRILTVIILSIVMIVVLAACSNNDSQSADNSMEQPLVSGTSANILTAFHSCRRNG